MIILHNVSIIDVYYTYLDNSGINDPYIHHFKLNLIHVKLDKLLINMYKPLNHNKYHLLIM